MLQRLNSAVRLIQRNTSEAPQRLCITSDLMCTRTISFCVKTRPARFIRKARSDRRGASWTADQDSSLTPDDRHGSDDLHRLDLRSPASARREGEGSTGNAASHRGSQWKNDRLMPARSPTFYLRCDLLPGAMTSRSATGGGRCAARGLLVKQMVQMKGGSRVC